MKITTTNIAGMSIPLIDGTRINTDDLVGKVVLFVNVASKCGFTPQYEALEALQRKYGPRGLVILGFPTDQFKQELGTEQAIDEFCKLNYDVTFPLSQKVWVNGRYRHPIFEKLTKAKDGLGLAGPVMWNFEKFLLLPNGEIRRYRSITKPDDAAIVDLIEANLS
ncbi:MAG: glutathione peroxidase [Actinomycetales bacterium]|nr:glutathione peroxidase [Actinomycetales bacterium]